MKPPTVLLTVLKVSFIELGKRGTVRRTRKLYKTTPEWLTTVSIYDFAYVYVYCLFGQMGRFKRKAGFFFLKLDEETKLLNLR